MNEAVKVKVHQWECVGVRGYARLSVIPATRGHGNHFNATVRHKLLPPAPRPRKRWTPFGPHTGSQPR